MLQTGSVGMLMMMSLMIMMTESSGKFRARPERQNSSQLRHCRRPNPGPKKCLMTLRTAQPTTPLKTPVKIRYSQFMDNTMSTHRNGGWCQRVRTCQSEFYRSCFSLITFSLSNPWLKLKSWFDVVFNLYVPFNLHPFF